MEHFFNQTGALYFSLTSDTCEQCGLDSGVTLGLGLSICKKETLTPSSLNSENANEGGRTW